MIKNFLFLLFMCFAISANAQRVGYTYNIFTNYNVQYSVAKNDSAYYIVVTIRSKDMFFLNKPTMKIRTFDGDIINLKGEVVGNKNEISTSKNSNGNIETQNIIYAIAQFDILPQQFDLIKNGIQKIRLSTTPESHERYFKKDKIGKKLYQFYLNEKQKDGIF